MAIFELDTETLKIYLETNKVNMITRLIFNNHSIMHFADDNYDPTDLLDWEIHRKVYVDDAIKLCYGNHVYHYYWALGDIDFCIRTHDDCLSFDISMSGINELVNETYTFNEGTEKILDDFLRFAKNECEQ